MRHYFTTRCIYQLTSSRFLFFEREFSTISVVEEKLEWWAIKNLVQKTNYFSLRVRRIFHHCIIHSILKEPALNGS